MLTSYIPRLIDRELDALLGKVPAVAIQGPRGAGKTETARRRANTFYDLDDPVQFELIQADPLRILYGRRPILIDEWQRLPELWGIILGSIGRDAAPGQYILTGSVSPQAEPAYSIDGKIASLHLRPMSLAERNLGTPSVSLLNLLTGSLPEISGQTGVELEEYMREIITPGFPELRKYSGRALSGQLDAYINRIVDRDFEKMGRKVRKPRTLRRWMAAYASASSTTASYETIRSAAARARKKPAKDTTYPYREILSRLWIIDEVPAWIPGSDYFSRLTKPPKHQLADTALAAALLGIDESALLVGGSVTPSVPRNGTLLGHLFKALVTQSVRVYAQASGAGVRHLHTMGGRHDIDIILERSDGKVVALEIKLGQRVDDNDVKSLLWLKDRMKNDLLDAAVINTGQRAYRRGDNIAVIPAALLGV